MAFPGDRALAQGRAREYDPATGLYYYRNRWDDPHLGRFISEDPIGLAGGINAYAYVANDPINFADPTGLICLQITRQRMVRTWYTDGSYVDRPEGPAADFVRRRVYPTADRRC